MHAITVACILQFYTFSNHIESPDKRVAMKMKQSKSNPIYEQNIDDSNKQSFSDPSGFSKHKKLHAVERKVHVHVKKQIRNGKKKNS